MRTYLPETFRAAKAQWDAGHFGSAWNRIRSIAATKGYIYPPTGSEHDDRDAAEPSQRAIVWRALQDNPRELERIVGRSSSWSQVVDGIFGLEARLAAGATERERDDGWNRKDEPNARQAAQSLGGIVERVAESLGYERRKSA